MSGRSNWEYKNQGTATERLARALSRPVNEAITVPVKDTKSNLDKGLDKNRASNAAKGRGQYINDMVDKASR